MPRFPVWALAPAELLNVDWTAVTVKYSLILISSEKVHGVSTIYMPRPRIDDIVKLIVKNFKITAAVARKIAEAVSPDLRQLNQRAKFGALFDTDRAAHLHFWHGRHLEGPNVSATVLQHSLTGAQRKPSRMWRLLIPLPGRRQCSSVIPCAITPNW